MKSFNRSLTIFCSFCFLYLGVDETVKASKAAQLDELKVTDVIKALQYLIAGLFIMLSVCRSQKFSNTFGFTEISWIKGLVFLYLGAGAIENKRSFYTYYGIMLMSIGVFIFVLSCCERPRKKNKNL